MAENELKQHPLMVMERDQIPSVLLRRLVDEIKQDRIEDAEIISPESYNRVHNRHNRHVTRTGRGYNRMNIRHNRTPPERS